MRTYDIINSGPKNRFMANGRIVSNSGRILNPQNFPRPTLSPEEIDFGIETLKANCADLFYENVMDLASNALRGVIVAPKGKKLLIADLSNIEGRYAAWLASEEWKLDYFRRFDRDPANTPDAYVKAYAEAFRVSVIAVLENKKAGGNWRQIGKTMELALIFGGGCGAFSTFAMSFGIDLQKLANDARDSIPSNIREEAEDFWSYAVEQKRTLGLERNVFVTCDSLKRLWRNAHPNIVRLWRQLEDAVRQAVETPGKSFKAEKLEARRQGNWLRIIMPSGRSLSYPGPQVDGKGQISFMGIDQYSRKWCRIKTFAGKLFNNVVQGGARDVFMHGVVNADKEGYETVLRVHDEIIAEVPDREDYTVKELCRLMTTGITWTENLPLAAGGFSAYRYKKAD